MTREEILYAIADKSIDIPKGMDLLKSTDPTRPAGALHCKVSPKGCVSVYGINSRMPVSLYAEQWERLLDGCPKDHFVLTFIRENEGKEYSSTHNVDGKKVPYTSKIGRKAAA